MIHVPVMKSPSGWGMSSFTWIVNDQLSRGVVFQGLVRSYPEMGTRLVALAVMKASVQSSKGMSLEASPLRKVLVEKKLSVSWARILGRRVARRRDWVVGGRMVGDC